MDYLETMKLLLINPKNVAWSSGTATLPVGLAYLASTLEQDSHEVRCIDMQVESRIDIQNEIKKYEIIGISSCTPSIKEAWNLARLAKEQNKLVILGGPHPTVLPEESLEKHYVDIIVRGEGEETIREICAGINLEKIPGISYKKNGKFIHNPQRQPIEYLDKLPFPARHLFNLKKYNSEFHKKKIVGNIFTSRGCPYNCSFCSNAVFGREYRMRTPENVIKEWKEMIRMEIEEINVADDNFTANPKRAITICNMLIDQGLNIPWTASGGLRVDSISKELLQVMKKSGCYRVALGAESGSQIILDKIGKRIKLQQIRDAVKICKEVGLETTVFFMIGNLGESEESMQMTINFAKELEPDFVQFTIAVPYPGSILYDSIKKYGKFLITDWEEYSSYEGKAYFEYGEMSKELVEKMFKKAYRDYYVRPKIIIKYLLKYNFKILKGLKFLK